MNPTNLTNLLHPKTKGWEYLKIFYENKTDLFVQFRELNNNPDTDTSTGSEFQQLGRQVELELFRLEDLLTSRQVWSKAKGLDKTVTAFYDLVETYFPLYGKIE